MEEYEEEFEITVEADIEQEPKIYDKIKELYKDGDLDTMMVLYNKKGSGIMSRVMFGDSMKQRLILQNAVKGLWE